MRHPRICIEDGCPEIALTSGRCSVHTRRSPSSHATSKPGWRGIRAAVLARDGNQCRLQLPGCTLYASTVDHVHRASDGGGNSLDNLQAACASCNQRKG